MAKPETKVIEADGQPRTFVLVDGSWKKACEDCFKPLPAYLELNMAEGQGFVSPESDKMRAVFLEGIPAIQALERAVCKECYRKAFKRLFPDASCPV
jgi:hypothetical protein